MPITKITVASFIVLLSGLVLVACTAQQVLLTGIDIARSGGDPAQAIKTTVRQRAESKKHQYATDPTRIARDLERASADFNQVMSFLMQAAGAEWGGDAQNPTRERYVKYVQNYKSRAMVDYDSGLITVETLIEENPERNLINAIVSTLLTPEDPRAVDLFSASQVKLSGRPFLQGLVRDHHGREIKGPRRAEAYAGWLVNNKLEHRSINVAGKMRRVHYAEFAMVNDYVSKSARKYQPLAAKYARRWGLSQSLVLAVMRAESNFNPYATSAVPAYGLMQLVPTTGGQDAYYHAKGVKRVPGKNYLYNPENNVELGTAYLHLLSTRHFKRIQNPTSREYLVIAGYNTGSGNVFRTFSAEKTEAINAINSMQPPQVYSTLKQKLPYAETRNYLARVLDYRRDFVNN